MPYKPKKPCAFPGCPNLTDGTYCEKHKKEAVQIYDKYERSPDHKKKYGRAWKRIRDKYAKNPIVKMRGIHFHKRRVAI